MIPRRRLDSAPRSVRDRAGRRSVLFYGPATKRNRSRRSTIDRARGSISSTPLTCKDGRNEDLAACHRRAAATRCSFHQFGNVGSGRSFRGVAAARFVGPPASEPDGSGSKIALYYRTVRAHGVGRRSRHGEWRRRKGAFSSSQRSRAALCGGACCPPTRASDRYSVWSRDPNRRFCRRARSESLWRGPPARPWAPHGHSAAPPISRRRYRRFTPR